MERGGGVKLDSHNLRDLLRMKEDDHHNNLNHCSASNGGEGCSNSSGLTLLALLTEKVGQPSPADESMQSVQSSSRTLLDIIREDRLSGYVGGRSDGGRSWRQLRDKIRLRQRGRGRGSSRSSAVPIRAADGHGMIITPRRHSDRFNSSFHSADSTHSGLSAAPDVAVRSPDAHRNSTREAETPNGGLNRTSSLPRSRSAMEDNHRSDEHPAGNADSGDAASDSEGSSEQPARTSLMSLLAQNDRQTGLKGSAFVDLKETVESGGDAAEYNNCCVCMVRQKGAAFIPCGHTFCRLCSRELWVQRGSCPICNNHILEILDIF